LLVALIILEIAGAAALATALTAERLGRHAAAGSAADAVRWQAYRQAERDSSCTARPQPDTVMLDFPATAGRPAITTTVRCGP
jgi:hypothetical protein